MKMAVVMLFICKRYWWHLSFTIIHISSCVLPFIFQRRSFVDIS